MVSDGDANMSCSNQGAGEDPRLSRNTSFNYDRDYYYSNYYRAIEHSADTPAYQYFGPSAAKAYDDKYGKGEFFNDGRGFSGYFDLPLYQYDAHIPPHEKKVMCQYTDYKFGYSDYYRRRMWIGSGEIIVPIWDRNYGNEKRGMRFFSQTLAEKDIKTEKRWQR